ncbi:hypothetical protein SEVIR_6G166450v4 [Setaria viridis]
MTAPSRAALVFGCAGASAKPQKQVKDFKVHAELVGAHAQHGAPPRGPLGQIGAASQGWFHDARGCDGRVELRRGAVSSFQLCRGDHGVEGTSTREEEKMWTPAAASLAASP